MDMTQPHQISPLNNDEPQAEPIFSFANAELGPISNACIRIIEQLTGQKLIKRLYLDYVDEKRPDSYFWRDALDRLKIKLVVKKDSESDIPKTGRLLIIANHPFGVIDGVALCAMVSEARSDYRILTHRVLRQAPAVMNNILPIDFDEDEKALLNNLKTRKDAVSHLKDGGAVIIFPAGAISLSPKFVDKAVDTDWKNFVAKMASVPDTTIMPFYFEGKNSFLFQLARRVSQTLGYALMFREIKKRIGTKLPVIMRKPIHSDSLNQFESRSDMTDYLRRVTYNPQND